MATPRTTTRRSGRLKRIQLLPVGPVSNACELRLDLLESEVKHALSVIDRVHVAGPLPRIPIDHGMTDQVRARFRVQINRGRVLGIGIDRDEPRPGLATVHEIGHFLDHQGLGVAGSYASRRHIELAGWRSAVTGSEEHQRLQKLHAISTAELAHRVGPDEVVEARMHLDYLLRSEEAWARSYVQFIVSESGDLQLQDEFARERDERFNSWGLWTADDFRSIRAAISLLFQRKGWIS